MSDGNGNTTALVTRRETQTATDLMPVMGIDQAIERYSRVVEFTKKVMKLGRDYGTIPGTEKKAKEGEPSSTNHTLLKPGAEKLCTLFGLSPRYVDWRVTEDWDKGLFYYGLRCILSRNGYDVAEAIGSCNSYEKRFRRVQRACPECGAAAIKRSKFADRDAPPGTKPGWYCFGKIGGCGCQFDAEDPKIVGQKLTTDPKDAADQANSVLKTAQKRALVAATLIATNASEFFTQDLEDGAAGNIHDDHGADGGQSGDEQPLPTEEENAAFADQVDDLFLKRGFLPPAIEAAKDSARKTDRVTRLCDIPAHRRPTLVKAINDGTFDRFKAQPTTQQPAAQMAGK